MLILWLTFIVLNSFLHLSQVAMFLGKEWVTNGISKEVLIMDLGLWLVIEFQGEKQYHFFHRPYMDGHHFLFTHNLYTIDVLFLCSLFV